MGDLNQLTCKTCHGHHFTLKYEATYVYSYAIDSDAPGLNNTDELLPFLYDNRDQKVARQYLQCDDCNQEYPCYFNDWDRETGLQSLQKLIDAT